MVELHADNRSHVVINGKLTGSFEYQMGWVESPNGQKLQEQGIFIRYKMDGRLFNLARLKARAE